MSYLHDLDLEFIEQCDNDDLGILLEIVRGKLGDLRLSESISRKEVYRQHFPNHRMYWREIAEELQRFGGNSVLNTVRGHGVRYKVILADVCDKVGVPLSDKITVADQEGRLLVALLERSVARMTEDERRQLLNGLDVPTTNLTSQSVIAAIQGIATLGSFGTYQIAVTVANAAAKAVLGRGLTFAGNAALTRAIGAATGPIGWAVTGLWTLKDLTSEAYRVTVPSCIQIAYMRAKVAAWSSGENLKSPRPGRARALAIKKTLKPHTSQSIERDARSSKKPVRRVTRVRRNGVSSTKKSRRG